MVETYTSLEDPPRSRDTLKEATIAPATAPATTATTEVSSILLGVL